MKGRVLVALALAAALGGCGSDSDEPPSDATAYEAAIGAVDPDAAQSSFEWVDREELSAMTGMDTADLADPSGRFSAITTLGTGPLSNVAGQGEDVYGFDPIGVPSSVSVGLPPDASTRFDGVDVAHVPAALDELGYSEASDGAYEVGEPGEPVLDGPLAEFALIGVNRVQLGDSSFTVAGTDEALALAGPVEGGSGALDDPAEQALADCIGDSVAVIRSDEGLADGAGLDAFAIAIPAFDDPEASVPERICAITPDADAANTLATTVEDGFGGVDPVSNVPFSEEIGRVDVAASEAAGQGVVTVTANPDADRPVGFLIQMWERGALNPVFGA